MPDPLHNISASGNGSKYDPERIFSTTSEMADKKFVSGTFSDAKGDASLQASEQTTFLSKPYDGLSESDSKTQDLHTAFATKSFATEKTDVSESTKSFTTTSADLGRGQAPLYASSTSTSTDQDRTAIFKTEKIEDLGTVEPMASKQYLGPGAQQVPDGIEVKENQVIWNMTGLPSRALTVDEVRNLINHGITPDTDTKPDESSKPLNDPDYKGDPLRESPPAPTATDDDKNNPVPSPGTLAQPPPENGEPLPSH